MKCKNCNIKFEPKYFNQKYCLKEMECIGAYNRSIQEQIRLKRSKDNKKKLKDLEPLSYWYDKLQTEINAIVRIIDKGLPCLARNIHANQIHAGHIYSRGGTPCLRYNLHNIHRQCAQSNHFQSDDLKLRQGLINEYGRDYMDYLEENRVGM